jgi:uncharacterized lipoprotein YmbA
MTLLAYCKALAWLIALWVAVLLAGCASGQSHQQYFVHDDFVVEVSTIGAIERLGGRGTRGVIVAGRWICVPSSGRRDTAGNALPDFEALGHEVWHLRQLGGPDFHPKGN